MPERNGMDHQDTDPTHQRLAVLIPCYNEAPTIAKVVTDFKASLPEAQIYVFDNNSTDDSGAIAARAGARVIQSPVQGKGHVVMHMFRIVEADVYVMADGDDTYPAAEAPKLIAALVSAEADMVVGNRLASCSADAFRGLHLWGNRLFAKLVSFLFGVRLDDILSGYRVFSRRFVQTMPLSSGGFGIEADMTLNALSKGLRILEVPIDYANRPEGSVSKLDTWRDGFVVLSAIAILFKDYKPFAFFGTLAAFLAGLSLFVGYFPIEDYVLTGMVDRFPLAILAASLGLMSALLFSVGLILDTMARYYKESYFLIAKALHSKSKKNNH